MSLSNLPPGVTNADIERTAGGYTGRELYELFQHKNAEHACVIDDWEDLDDVDRACWCALATEIS